MIGRSVSRFLRRGHGWLSGRGAGAAVSSRVTVSRETIDSVERSVRTHGCAADVSFEFTVLSDDRFIEILQAWVDSPWPKTAEDGYALRDHFGWTPSENKPDVFTSDVVPDELSASFTSRQGVIGSFDFPITDIAPEEAWGDSLEDALVIYRHFCDILTSRYGKPKRRKNRNGYYRSNFVTSQGVGVSVGGTIAHVSCVVKSPEEMFIESEYARLVAKGYISEDE